MNSIQPRRVWYFLMIKYESGAENGTCCAVRFHNIGPYIACCSPSWAAEDANAMVDRWSASYSGNDPENVAKNYWSDAILLGTVSPVMSEGTEAIVTYFTPLKGSGNKNTID